MLFVLFKVIRPKDTVYVGLYRRKDTNECSLVNLTKGHICPCKFSSVEEAIADMEKQKKRGSILSYVEIKQMWIKVEQPMKTQEIIKALRSTPSRSKRALLDAAADKIEELEKDKAALISDMKKLEETGEMCILCSHCCAGGKPVYQQSDDYLEYCTSCDEGYSNFEWRGAPEEKTDSGLLEE